MRVLAIYMTTGPNHVVFVESGEVWAAFPTPKGCRIYLQSFMDSPVRPSMAVAKLPPEDVLGVLLRGQISGTTGSMIDVNGTVEEVAAACGLAVFDLRMEPAGMKVALMPALVVAVAPAIGESGAAMGSNIFMARQTIETDSRVVQVVEQIPAVLERIEWHGKVVQIGQPFVPPPVVVAANEPRVIVPDSDVKH